MQTHIPPPPNNNFAELETEKWLRSYTGNRSNWVDDSKPYLIIIILKFGGKVEDRKVHKKPSQNLKSWGKKCKFYIIYMYDIYVIKH